MLTQYRNRLLVSLVAWIAAATVSAEIITAVGDGNVLLVFDHAAPGTALSSNPLTGLQPGEQILAIDSRPASGQLYALKVVGFTGDRTGEAVWVALDRQAVQVDADAAATAVGATGYTRRPGAGRPDAAHPRSRQQRGGISR